MGAYAQELAEAGVLLGGDGLRPSAEGKRVAFDGPDRTVLDGPFETAEVVSGYWLWEVADMHEAVEWTKRSPNPMLVPSEIEIRPVSEPEDFGEALTPELAEREERLREELSER